MKGTIITLLILHLGFLAYSQDIGYEVRGTYSQPLAKEILGGAKTVSDINPGFPASWISHYYSVQVSTICNGIIRQAVSENDTLTQEQMDILKKADMGTDVVVDVKYNPKNSLNKNVDVRVINFTRSVIPEIEAQYVGGYDVLKGYLKENAIDRMPEKIASQLQQATVRFTIDEEGQVADAHISKTSEDEETDKLLLEVINSMPKWKPAEDGGDTKVKQEFEFSVGNMIGC